MKKQKKGKKAKIKPAKADIEKTGIINRPDNDKSSKKEEPKTPVQQAVSVVIHKPFAKAMVHMTAKAVLSGLPTVNADQAVSDFLELFD